jgi:hypothetical protein
MATVKFEPRPGVVIEIPNLPVTSIVTLLALGAEASFVHIVFSMTSEAVGRSLVLIELSCMTAFASS